MKLPRKRPSSVHCFSLPWVAASLNQEKSSNDARAAAQDNRSAASDAAEASRKGMVAASEMTRQAADSTRNTVQDKNRKRRRSQANQSESNQSLPWGRL